MVMVVNRKNSQLSTFVNGRMVATSTLNKNELPELRLSDWFVGGPGPFNSNQDFAGQIDDLRFYDDALSQRRFPVFTIPAKVMGNYGDRKCPRRHR